MEANYLLYKTLKSIQHERSFPLTTHEYNHALVELGWVEDAWDVTITKDGLQVLNLLSSLYER